MRIVGCLPGIAAVVGIVCLGTANGRAEDAMKKGAWALQFEVNQDFDLSAFQGSTISIKKQVADGLAYRLGLDIEVSDVNSDTDEQDFQYNHGEISNQSDVQSTHTDHGDQSFTLTAQRVSYPRHDARMKFFYGAGPLFSYAHLYDKRSIDEDHAGRYQEQKTTTNNWSVGMTGILGVEWFASSTISFLAEYRTALAYNWGHTDYYSLYRSSGSTDQRRERTSDSDRIDLGAGAVKFGLSAYF